MALPIEQFFNDLKYYLNQNSVSDEQSICSDTQYNWYYRKDKPLHNIFTCSFDDNYQNIITHTWNFIKLPSNWDGYDSDKLSHDVIQNAINLINNISYQSVEILEIEDVNPTSNGTIVIEWFYNDITPKEKVLNNKVSVPLTQNEYDALLSLMYNIGEPRFLTSTLLKLLNQNKKDLAAKEFLKWNKVKGKVSSGLSKRRMSEMAIFLAKNTQ